VAEESFDPTTGEVAERVDDVTARPDWRVDSIGALEWAFERLADLEAEKADNEALEAAAVDRLRARVRQLNAKLDRGIAFFRGHIAVFAGDNRAELLGSGKKKSREFPRGKLAWRTTRGGLRVADEKELLTWALAQDPRLELVSMHPRPALGPIREHAAKAGIIPPGMAEEPPHDELSITAIGDELTKRSNGNE
jgi:phage host-nuclease inhibitor protein Gam